MNNDMNFRKLSGIYSDFDLDSLLCSRTYRPNDCEERCIYCDNEVDTSLASCYIFDGWVVSAHKCSCSKAIEELKIKWEFLQKFRNLNHEINTNSKIFLMKEYPLDKVYEDFKKLFDSEN